MVNVRLYFKASQLPEGVYQRLMEDRNGENLGESLFLFTFLLAELFDWVIKYTYIEWSVGMCERY